MNPKFGSRLLVLRETRRVAITESDQAYLTYDDLREKLLSPNAWKWLFRFSRVEFRVYHISFIPRRWMAYLALWLISSGPVVVTDDFNMRSRVHILRVLSNMLWALFEVLCKPFILLRIRCWLKRIENAPRQLQMNERSSVLYLRTDLIFGVLAGGSVAHISGVVNEFYRQLRGAVIFGTTDSIPNVNFEIPSVLIWPKKYFWNLLEVPSMIHNLEVVRALSVREFDFIYQRYSLNNFSGVVLSKTKGLPLILEYNGSEVWIHQQWGHGLHHKKLSERIERLNLMSADVVVVVSKPLKDDLIKRGISENKILVNPNGVDMHLYSPGVSSQKVRDLYEIDDQEIVIGFIGSFGKWHGAEILASAFIKLLSAHPDLQDKVRIIFIGSGVTLASVKQAIEASAFKDRAIFTGTIPQVESPEYLAACDIFSAPHVANADGTPFFGSPTKLFEYMAMERAIVASNLDQIGEILEDQKTALLVTPGSADDLMKALEKLIRDPELRVKLAREARVAVQQHSWKAHTEKILKALPK